MVINTHILSIVALLISYTDTYQPLASTPVVPWKDTHTFSINSEKAEQVISPDTLTQKCSTVTLANGDILRYEMFGIFDINNETLVGKVVEIHKNLKHHTIVDVLVQPFEVRTDKILPYWFPALIVQAGGPVFISLRVSIAALIPSCYPINNLTVLSGSCQRYS